MKQLWDISTCSHVISHDPLSSRLGRGALEATLLCASTIVPVKTCVELCTPSASEDQTVVSSFCDKSLCDCIILNDGTTLQVAEGVLPDWADQFASLTG